MGCPSVLITDQGREFVNELSAKLYGMTKTEHRISSAYHPQTNGLTERFNQTLSRCLAKAVNDSQDDWDELIDTILMGYRASPQSSTKYSPYFMLFQSHMRLPIDSEIMSPNFDLKSAPSQTDLIVADLLAKRAEVFENASENIISAQQKQKEQYNSKHKQTRNFTVGDKVLLENTAQKQRKGGKLQPYWLGPYFVGRELGTLLLAMSVRMYTAILDCNYYSLIMQVKDCLSFNP